MKTYTVLYAQDVPHYGSVEICARNDEQAVAKARAYWKRLQRGKEPWPLYDAQHDSALLDRIVDITDTKSGRQIAADIGLDDYGLHRLSKLLREAETLLKACLKHAKAADGPNNDAEHDAAFDMRCAALGFLRSAANGDPRFTALIDRYKARCPELD